MMSRLFVTMVLVASALASAAPPAAAASLVVCDSGCTYATIQSAINAAATGDTVVVRPGTYAEAITIDESITVCSTGPSGNACNLNAENTIIAADQIYPVMITADDVVFKGFTINNDGFTAVDPVGGFVDPSAIVVYGVDGVTISDNVIDAPASIPLAGESRKYTIGINVGTDNGVPTPARSDDVTLLRNTMNNFPPSTGPGSSCTDCAVYGIMNWGAGTGFVAKQNDIRLGNTGLKAFGIKFNNNPDTEVTGNFIRMPSSAPGSAADVVGIDGGVTDGALIKDNDVAVTLTSTPGGLYGIWGVFSNTEFRGNYLRLAQHGIVLRSSTTGDNLVVDNHFALSNQGLLNYADNTQVLDNLFENLAGGAILLDAVDAPGGPYSQSENVVISGNTFRTNPTNLVLTDTVTDTFVDARRNDWGVYTAADIEAANDDSTGTNDVDISCFIGSDGTTEVCPLAAIMLGVPSSGSWPRTLTATDASTFPGSELGSRTWTLPDGSTSSAAAPTVELLPGTHTWTLDVTDAEGFADSATATLTLTNNAPTLTFTGTHTTNEGVAISIALGAADLDGDTLVYSLVSGPAGATISGGSLSYNPGFGAAGSYPVTVSVTDGAATTSASGTIDVVNVPVGATIANIANLNILETKTGSRTITASSPSGSAIALSADDGVLTGTFTQTGNSGTYTYTAPAGSAGSYPVTITAVSEGITTTKTFNVIIAQNAALSLVRTTPAVLKGSPGETLNVGVSIINLGSGDDTFTLTITNSRGWANPAVAPVEIAAGAVGPATIPMVVSATGDFTVVTIKVCSSASPTVCATTTARLEVPIFVSVSMESVYGVLDEIGGTVKVTFQNGNAASGVAVVVSERHAQNLFLLKSEVEGVTGADGEYDFVLGDLVASALGTHNVTVSASRGAAVATASTSYTVGP